MTSYNPSLECCPKKRIDYCNNIMPSVIPHCFQLKESFFRRQCHTGGVRNEKMCTRSSEHWASRLLTKASNTFLWHERTWRNIMLSVACSCLQVNKAGYHRRTSHQSAAGWMRQQLRHQVIKDGWVWGLGDEGLIFLDAELTVCTQLECNHATWQHQAVALTPFSEEVCVWPPRSSKSGYLTSICT